MIELTVLEIAAFVEKSWAPLMASVLAEETLEIIPDHVTGLTDMLYRLC